MGIIWEENGAYLTGRNDSNEENIRKGKQAKYDRIKNLRGERETFKP